MNVDQAYQTLKGFLRKVNLPLDDHEILQGSLALLYETAKDKQEDKEEKGKKK